MSSTPTPITATVVPSPKPRFGLPAVEILALAVASTAILTLSYANLWPISVAEAWGFATGAVCVWLVVREHLANWPIGLANNAFFFVLFLESRLYADMGLQVVYFALGVYGLLNWLRGGERGSPLEISRTTRVEWIVLIVAVPVGTIALREVLIAANGAAPVWDAVTTILSLAAQYLLCRKRIEHWYFWIVADLIYVPLYVSRALPLTALLYGVFLLMCLFGTREWRGRIRHQRALA